MPIFEYECRECGGRVERLIRSENDAPRQCPTCGSKKLEKALSTFSVGAGGGYHQPSPERCSTCSSGSCPYSGGL